ncbi:MAG: hypothetical protein PHS95_02525, partial [Candidatus Pacebacteria bacterium]|nr:hypothetical protein [Candidatus Paceibacterota bacterium]
MFRLFEMIGISCRSICTSKVFFTLCLSFLLVVSVLYGAFSISHAQMPNRYWVGSAGGNWSDSANWSESANSCGVGGGASVPGTSDIAYFVSNCTNSASMNATIDVAGIDIASGYSGTISPSSSVSITAGTSGFVQAGGTFTSTAGTMVISGTFNRTGGTFNHNSGTVIFKAPIYGGSYNITPGSSLTFNNLIFDQLSGGYYYTDTITITGSFTVAGDLTVRNTNTDYDSYTVTGSGSPTITVSGNLLFPSTAQTNTVSFGGDYMMGGSTVTINLVGNFTMSDSNVTSYANVTFNGTSTQTVTQSAGTVSGGTWTVNKASGNFALGSNAGGSEAFTLTQGTVSTGTYNFSSAAFIQNTGTTFTGGAGTIDTT